MKQADFDVKDMILLIKHGQQPFEQLLRYSSLHGRNGPQHTSADLPCNEYSMKLAPIGGGD
jgi:hypothetical protein